MNIKRIKQYLREMDSSTVHLYLQDKNVDARIAGKAWMRGRLNSLKQQAFNIEERSQRKIIKFVKTHVLNYPVPVFNGKIKVDSNCIISHLVTKRDLSVWIKSLIPKEWNYEIRFLNKNGEDTIYPDYKVPSEDIYIDTYSHYMLKTGKYYGKAALYIYCDSKIIRFPFKYFCLYMPGLKR